MNPFKYGTVVEEPFFFDRKDELKRIVETLKGGNNVVLYAPRRYGKTSLVIKAMDGLINDGIIDKQGNHYLFNDPFFKRTILRLSA